MKGQSLSQISSKFAALEDDLLNAQTMEEKAEIYLSMYPEWEQKERVKKKIEEIMKNKKETAE